MSSTGRDTGARRMARVVVIDDHPFFRDGLTRGLRQSGYLEVIGEAGTGREGLELIRELQPNVAVVDYQMPDLDGLDVVHAIVRDGLPTRTLILSALTDSAVVFRALEEGRRVTYRRSRGGPRSLTPCCGLPRVRPWCHPS